MRRSIFQIYLGLSLLFLTACSSLPMAKPEEDQKAKEFSTSATQANIYIYRNEFIGGAVKMDVLFDGQPIGQTTAKTFFLVKVPPGKHSIMSRCENDDFFEVDVVANKNYFIWQEVKMGFMYARTKLHLIDEGTGMAGVKECKLISNRN